MSDDSCKGFTTILSNYEVFDKLSHDSDNCLMASKEKQHVRACIPNTKCKFSKKTKDRIIHSSATGYSKAVVN